jgi:hypothetical protein
MQCRAVTIEAKVAWVATMAAVVAVDVEVDKTNF